MSPREEAAAAILNIKRLRVGWDHCFGSREKKYINSGLIFPLSSEVMASSAGHWVIPVGRSPQRGWRWSHVTPHASLTHTAATWPSPARKPVTREHTTANTPGMVWTTPPLNTSMSKVRQFRRYGLFNDVQKGCDTFWIFVKLMALYPISKMT